MADVSRNYKFERIYFSQFSQILRPPSRKDLGENSFAYLIPSKLGYARKKNFQKYMYTYILVCTHDILYSQIKRSSSLMDKIRLWVYSVPKKKLIISYSHHIYEFCINTKSTHQYRAWSTTGRVFSTFQYPPWKRQHYSGETSKLVLPLEPSIIQTPRRWVIMFILIAGLLESSGRNISSLTFRP